MGALTRATVLIGTVLVGAVLAASVLAGTVLTGPAPAAAAEDEPAAGALNYVALGDSFTAGFGVGPYSQQPAPGCYQSEQNYPHLVAAKLELTLTDASCSGAVTANIIDTPQTTITGEGTAPVQSESLTADTDIVTVTIGGNDLGFSDIATNCAAATASGPTYSGYWTCKEFYDLPANDLKAKIDTIVAPALAKTYALIKSKAPKAKIFVIGYPALAPDADNTPAEGCFRSLWYSNAFPFTAADTAMIHAVEVEMGAAIKAQAEAAGAVFVPTLAQSLAHSACAAADTAYIEGVTLSSDADPEAIKARGLQSGDIAVGALHPNARGIAFLDEVVAEAISSALGSEGVGLGGAEPVGERVAASESAPNVEWVPWTVGGGLLALLVAAGVVIVVRQRTRP